ncbi:MAG: hypothetical protein GXO34_02560 [Deltaproteobacteria bacterium]|nr:hypothetical protein [Deltaproteobacteria bacterium]
MVLFFIAPLQASNLFLDYVDGTRIYFSHIAVAGGWETEIAALNPTAGNAVITLTPYDKNGNPVGDPVQSTIKAHGRYLRIVGRDFARAADIAYILMTSPVFGLKGYSKFYQGSGAEAIRASIMASEPKTSGLFTKIDHDGWTGIAFINTGATTAHITLTAYNDQGSIVAQQSKTVAPGEKVVDIAQKLFSQSIANAAYVEFTSDQKVVGFFLNGSADGSMLDGSQAL